MLFRSAAIGGGTIHPCGAAFVHRIDDLMRVRVDDDDLVLDDHVLEAAIFGHDIDDFARQGVQMIVLSNINLLLQPIQFTAVSVFHLRRTGLRSHPTAKPIG